MDKDLETIIEPRAAAIERSNASFEMTVVSALRIEQSFIVGFVNREFRPEARVQGGPYERAVSARKRSSA